jgi:hypothetical protein
VIPVPSYFQNRATVAFKEIKIFADYPDFTVRAKPLTINV